MSLIPRPGRSDPEMVQMLDRNSKLDKKTIYIYNPPIELLKWLEEKGVAVNVTKTRRLASINDDFSLFVLSKLGSIKARLALEERKEMSPLLRIRSVLKKHKRPFSAEELAKILDMNKVDISKLCRTLLERREIYKDTIQGTELYYYNFDYLKKEEDIRRRRIRGTSKKIAEILLNILRWGTPEEVCYVLKHKTGKDVNQTFVLAKLQSLAELGTINLNSKKYYVIFGIQKNGRTYKRYSITDSEVLHEIFQSGAIILLKPKLKYDPDSNKIRIGNFERDLNTLKEEVKTIKVYGRIAVIHEEKILKDHYYFIDVEIPSIKGVLEIRKNNEIITRINTPHEYKTITQTAKENNIIPEEEFLSVECEYEMWEEE